MEHSARITDEQLANLDYYDVKARRQHFHIKERAQRRKKNHKRADMYYRLKKTCDEILTLLEPGLEPMAHLVNQEES